MDQNSSDQLVLDVNDEAQELQDEEKRKRHAEVMKEIEESLRRDQEENKNFPEKVVIDGLEFSNIRVREISLEPFEDENKENELEPETDTNSPEIKSRDAETDQERHDDIMKEIEESLRRDQEENKKLPEKIVIDGLEFSNIRVRDISLEPKEENEEPEPQVRSRSLQVEPEPELKVQSRSLQAEQEPEPKPKIQLKSSQAEQKQHEDTKKVPEVKVNQQQTKPQSTTINQVQKQEGTKEKQNTKILIISVVAVLIAAFFLFK